MVDVTTLEFYKEKPEKDGEKMIPYLNVERALDNELEYEWLKIVRAYEDDASVFDDQGKIIEGKKVKKMHLDLEYEKEQYKWPLNQTNYKTMLSDFGKESDNWEREFIKIKVHEWQSGTKGLVVISRKELKKLDVKIPERDEDGGDPSSSSSGLDDLLPDTSEVEVVTVKDEGVPRHVEYNPGDIVEHAKIVLGKTDDPVTVTNVWNLIKDMEAVKRDKDLLKKMDHYVWNVWGPRWMEENEE